MQRAREQLRPLVSEADVRRVQETLREDGALSADVWVKRLKQVQAKLRGGDPLELAEVVRDGARRERMLSGKGSKSQLSRGERELYLKSRQLLSREIGLARGLEPRRTGNQDAKVLDVGSSGARSLAAGREEAHEARDRTAQHDGLRGGP